MTMIETPVKKTPKIGDGTPGPGRTAGSLNRTTKALKDAIILGAMTADARLHYRAVRSDPTATEEQVAEAKAAAKAGDGTLEGYCAHLAEFHPATFGALLGRVLPIQIKSQGTPLDPQQQAGVNELGTLLAFALRLGAVQKPEPKTINHNPTEKTNDRKI